MIRNRKVLGLTFLTMLTALAMTASPAMTLKGDDKKNGAEVTIGWDE